MPRKRKAEAAPESLIPELLTLTEASQRYGVSTRTLHHWRGYGILETRWAGRTLVTSPAAVESAITRAPKKGRPRKQPASNQASAASKDGSEAPGAGEAREAGQHNGQA